MFLAHAVQYDFTFIRDLIKPYDSPRSLKHFAFDAYVHLQYLSISDIANINVYRKMSLGIIEE
jgi:hypothetical protein